MQCTLHLQLVSACVIDFLTAGCTLHTCPAGTKIVLVPVQVGNGFLISKVAVLLIRDSPESTAVPAKGTYQGIFSVYLVQKILIRSGCRSHCSGNHIVAHQCRKSLMYCTVYYNHCEG